VIYLKEDIINQILKENANLKSSLTEQTRKADLVGIELDVVRRERNDNILQIHNLVKETTKPFHVIKDSISSMQSFSTMTDNDSQALKNILDKANNEKFVLEGMLYEFKIKYAEIQNEIGKYRDQNTSLRRKLEEANEGICKKDEIIQKLMLSKEKVLLLENNTIIPTASRLDITMAYTEGLNNNQLGKIMRSGTPRTDIKPFKYMDETTHGNYLTTSPSDMTFCKASTIKSNYNTVNNNKMLDITLSATPERKVIDKPVFVKKNSSSFFKKIKNMLFSEKKQAI